MGRNRLAGRCCGVMPAHIACVPPAKGAWVRNRRSRMSRQGTQGRGRIVSSFAWMKFLESSPQRYDRGIAALSSGRIREVYADIARRAVASGRRILDMGCGTGGGGGVSLACAALGADVVGIDINAGMLEVARAKPVPGSGRVEWYEFGGAEIEDRFPPQAFDAVVSCLVFSELSPDEQAYAARTAFGRLRPGGRVIVADETLPRSALSRAWCRLRRAPLAGLTYLVTQTTTRPVGNLAGLLTAAEFTDIRQERRWSDNFCIVDGRRPGGA